MRIGNGFCRNKTARTGNFYIHNIQRQRIRSGPCLFALLKCIQLYCGYNNDSVKTLWGVYITDVYANANICVQRGDAFFSAVF
ncbi:hypothetical protein D3C80_1933740 [compost metagenome]